MANATLVNFAAGETSPKSRGRFDIGSYLSSCRKLENFISEVTGAARYRPGFQHLAETRGGAVARLIPFQFNDEQAYMLEFTPGKMRVYVNGALKTIERSLVTGITKANPAVITVSSTSGLVNGDEVIITGIVGMTELNGRQVKLAGASGSTFQLVDPTTGANINSSSFGTYVSGGAISEVYEVATPYISADMVAELQFSQAGDGLYLVSPYVAARKISVLASGEFTIAIVSFTSGPFTGVSGVGGVYYAVDVAGKTEIAFYSGSGYSLPTLSSKAIYTLTVSGMAAAFNGLNGRAVYLDIYLRTENFAVCRLIDATTLAYITVGATATELVTAGKTFNITPDNDHPIAVATYESRLIYAGTDRRPRTMFGSRSPVPTTGASRYDDFTGGTDPDHACFFTLAPVNGSVDYISWAGGSTKYLIVGTFGGAFRVSGGGLDEPITPSSINVRQLDAFGCAATMPALNGAYAYFIQRGGTTVRTVKYASDVDDFATFDLCLNAEQIGHSELKRVVLQTARPDVLWVVRADGQLAGCTIQEGERVAGWHRHKLGGTAAKVLDVAVLPRPGLPDQLYIVTERTVGGVTRRAVEAMADEINFPDPEDYFTGEGNEAADAASYAAAVTALQKTVAHLDAYEYYSGVASATISGLHHLEGETVTALADGVVVENLTVANGAITLPTAASVVVVGLPYVGLLQTQNLEVNASGTGPAQAKPRNICKLNIRFLNSLGCEYGTDLYHLEDVYDDTGRVFSGIKELHNSDSWLTPTREKTVYIVQQTPLPCVVQFIDMEFATGED